LSLQALKPRKNSVPKNFRFGHVIPLNHSLTRVLANIGGNRTKDSVNIESDVFKKQLIPPIGFKHYDISSLLDDQDVHQMKSRKAGSKSLEIDLDLYIEDIDLDITPYSTQIINVSIEPLEDDDEEDLWY